MNIYTYEIWRNNKTYKHLILTSLRDIVSYKLVPSAAYTPYCKQSWQRETPAPSKIFEWKGEDLNRMASGFGEAIRLWRTALLRIGWVATT